MEKQQNRVKRGKSVRARGLQFERDIANDLKAVGFKGAQRQLEFQVGDQKGVDIKLEDSQFKIQCKAKQTQPNIPQVFSEIVCSEDDIPVVVFKVINKGTYACFRWEDAKVLMGWLENFVKKN